MRKKMKLCKKYISLFLAVMMMYSVVFTGHKVSAATTDSNNGDWSSQSVTLTNTNEAALMVRAGDIDNFGFGWGNINPFSGNETSTHSYPFYPSSSDTDGTDRIMVISGYSYDSNYKSTGTNRDGYTETTSRSDRNLYNSTDNDNNVRGIDLKYSLSNITVSDAAIQMFVDDFQPGTAHGITSGNAKYVATINGQEIPELSNLINNLDESGPIGKLITFQIPDSYLNLVKTGELIIKIDDTVTGSTGDGYAIDFVKLLINKKGYSNTATISGYVKDSSSRSISGATVSTDGSISTTTDSNGYYNLSNVPAGQAVVTASKTGYISQTYTEKTVIAGNTYRHDFTLSSDTTPPTLTLTQSPTSATSGTVTITATASDSGSGVATITKPDSTSVTGSSTTYSVSTNGTYTFKATDNAGNITTQSITVSNIDTTGPTLTLTQNPTSATSGTVTITATASDSGSGVASITKPDGTSTSGSSTTYSVSSNGTYTFKATDNVGNVTSQTINVSNISSTNTASKPQFNVTMDSYTPTNAAVGDEITFNGTIHPQDFQMSIPAKEIVLVLDSSGSMADNSKLTNLKIAAKDFISKMSTVDNLKIAVVDFDTQASINSKLISSKNVTTLDTAIDNLVASGGTNTGEGLRLGTYLLANSSEQSSTASKTIVFMSDGEPTYYNGKNITGSWVKGSYSGKYYNYNNTKYGIDSQHYYNYNSYYNGNYTGYRYIYSDSGYYADTTKSTVDSNIGLAGSGNDDYQGKCLTYATTIGSIIKSKGYNTFSIGYGLDSSGTSKMQQIHNSMSSVSSNFFTTDANSIDSVFNSIADTILASYPITNVNLNFDSTANSSIISVDGNTVNLPSFSYTKVSQSDTTVTYKAEDVPFTIKIKSNTSGSNIPVFKNSTVTFPWQGNTISANVPTQYINIKANTDTTPPTLILTQSPTGATKGSVVITATASDSGSGVASITKPDSTIVTDSSTTYTVSDNGTYTFSATDNAGNATTQTITISNIDKTAPTLTLTQSPGSATNGTVTISATASDSGSGVASITKPDASMVSSSSATYTVSDNGTYTFSAADNVGNITTQTITINNIDKVAPTLTLTQNPETATSETVTITATASDSGSGVESITKPDSTVATDSSTTYTVNVNDTYTFTARDKAGNTTTQNIDISNINAQSIIKAHGLYNGSDSDISDNNKLTVTNTMPITMAIEVDAESSNPQISWTADKSKISEDNITFKEYEILSDGTIGNLQTVTLSNSGDINLTGLTMEKGKQYIIIYTITPVGSGDFYVTATADKTSSKSVDLTIVDTPDLF